MALQNDLTAGNVRRQILRFSIPLIASNMLQALYNTVDMFFVGKFAGTAALSSVSVCGPLMNLLIMTISGLSVGVSIVIGGHMGAGSDEKEIKVCANTAITLYLLISAAVSVIGWILAPSILQLVQTPPEAFTGAVEYFRTILAGIVFMFGYNLIGAFQRGFGDSNSSFLFVAVATLVNIVLDWLFIGPFQMGAFGAAIATVIAQATSLIMGVVYFRMKKHVIDFSLKNLGMDRAQMKAIFRHGTFPALQSLLGNLSSTTVNSFANSFGVAASAAYGICLKTETFGTLPGQALMMAMSSFSSQNISAGKPDRAYQGLKEARKVSWCFAIFFIVVFYTFAPNIVRIFDDNPEVIALGVPFMRRFCFVFAVVSTTQPMIGFLRGTGNGFFTIISVLMTQYAIKIPVSYALIRVIGFNGLAIAAVIAPMLAVAIYSTVIFTGRWKKSPEAKKSFELKARIEALREGAGNGDDIEIVPEGEENSKNSYMEILE